MSSESNSPAVERLRAVVRHRRGVRLAILFGSFARATEHAESDVDVAMLLDEEVSVGEELALQEDLARTSGRAVDLVRLETADVILRHRVAREGVLLFEREPSGFARFAADAALEYLDLEPLLLDARERFLRKLTAGPA